MFRLTYLDEKLHVVNCDLVDGRIKFGKDISYPLATKDPIVIPQTTDPLFISQGSPNKIYLAGEDLPIYSAMYNKISLVGQYHNLLYIIDANYLIKFDLTSRKILKRLYLGVLDNDSYESIIVSSDYVIITINRVYYFTLNFYIIRTDFTCFVEYFLEETETILGFINKGKTLVLVNDRNPICLVNLETCNRSPIILDFAWLNSDLSYIAILEEESLIIIDQDQYYEISAKEGLFKLDDYRLKNPTYNGQVFAVKTEKNKISAQSVYLHQEGNRIKNYDLPYYQSSLLDYLIDFYPQINGTVRILFDLLPSCDLITEVLTHLHPSKDKVLLYKLVVLIGKRQKYQSKQELFTEFSTLLS